MADLEEVLVEFDATRFKRYYDARAAELEPTNFVTFAKVISRDLDLVAKTVSEVFEVNSISFLFR